MNTLLAGDIGNSHTALGLVPGHPPVRALPGNPELLGNVRDRATTQHAGDQQQPAMGSQTSISVGHEDLRVW